MLVTSYHNHTNRSDGEGSLLAMIARAYTAAVDELGISDHYVLCPDGAPMPWSMPLESLDAYVDAVLEAANASPLTLRLGMEVDFFPETVDDVRARLAPYPFDYLIGSVHIVDGFPVDEDAAHWEALSQSERDEAWRLYWVRVRQMAESGAFDIVGHLDIPKKFGFFPAIDLSAEVGAALDAIAASGMSIELNTAGWRKPIGEAYPSPGFLYAANRRNIPLVITADAHTPQHITADFLRAHAEASAAGYTMLSVYEQRRRSDDPL